MQNDRVVSAVSHRSRRPSHPSTRAFAMILPRASISLPVIATGWQWRLAVFAAVCVFLFGAVVPDIRAADETSKSSLEADPGGWVDIMPPPDLGGWVRVPIKAGGKLLRDQWHMENGLLVCDGDGGHDMLLLNREVENAIFPRRVPLYEARTAEAVQQRGVRAHAVGWLHLAPGAGRQPQRWLFLRRDPGQRRNPARFMRRPNRAVSRRRGSGTPTR